MTVRTMRTGIGAIESLDLSTKVLVKGIRVLRTLVVSAGEVRSRVVDVACHVWALEYHVLCLGH